MPDEEKLTAEEQSAYEAMQNEESGADLDTKSEDEESTTDESTTSEDAKDEEGQSEAEFKSTRTDDTPDWSSLTEDQRESVKRVLEGKPPKDMVPHAALHETREGMKALKAELDELKGAQASKGEPEPEYVDPLQDPEGFRKWAEHQQGKSTQANEELRQQAEQRQQQEDRVRRASAYEQQFAAKAPDYFDAVNHLQQSRVQELRSMGYGDDQVSAQIAQDTNELFDAAERMRINPAELAYWRAQQTGYKPKPKDDADKMAAQESARKQTQGVSDTGGTQSGKVTVEQMGRMSPEELAKIPEEDIEAAFGG